ncbi:MAG: glycosyltransferase family 4 protein [Vicinamibacteria bacterium]
MKRVNVLYLVRTWGVGGAHTIIRLLLHRFARSEFHIVTVPYAGSGNGDQEFVDYLAKHDLKVADERVSWRSPFSWSQARREVLRLIRKHDIDLVHTHDNLSNLLVGVDRSGWDCARVASAYGWWEPRWDLKVRTYYWLEKRLALPNFDRVYTVSAHMKQKVQRGGAPESKVRVIRTGLDLFEFGPTTTRASARSELGLPADALVVGTVSRLYREKGHRYLIEALHALKDTHPRLMLLVVGAGYMRASLERRSEALGVRNRIVFAGYVDDLAAAMRAMDIFALPSILDEGLPTAALEAQAAGLPVIASDIGGTSEAIIPGETGVLVRPKDVHALTAAISALSADEARRAAMGLRARSWVQESFSVDRMMSQITAMYHEALSTFRERRRGM